MESVATTQSRILEALTPLRRERVPLAQALGRVLATPVTTGRPVPAFANSAMDGFAVREGDVRDATISRPVLLPVDGAIAAGCTEPALLRPGTAQRIATGAPLPDGADTVVPDEQTDRGSDIVAIHTCAGPGAFVRPAGHDMTPGAVAVMAGRRLRPGDLAACAAAGVSGVEVARRPRVAVLSTGAELVPLGTEPRFGQVIDSNSVALIAAISDAGGVAIPLGIAGDTPEAIRNGLRTAAGCDLILSSAGVSVGEHDHVRNVVADMGSIDLWRVSMRPGKPVAVGNVGGTPFLGLPGNPVSSYVTFELFARPAILALQGAADPHRRRFAARLTEDVIVPSHLETYIRAAFTPSDEALPAVRPTDSQDSSALKSLARADGLIVIPAGSAEVKTGSVVQVLPLQ